MHDTQALTIDPTAIEVWLRQPSDEHPAFSHAEYLGVHDEVSGPGEEDFLPTIGRVLAAEPDGLHRRADVTRVELWLIPDGEVLYQGALITVDLADGIRLATLHQDAKDFADRDQRGVPAILTALDHVAAQACLLIERYQATHPSGPVPADGHATTSSTVPAPATFTEGAVRTAANRAADDILDAVDAGATGLRDGLNLLVNATLGYLTGEAEDLTEVVGQNYEATYDEVLSWIEQG